MTKDEALKLALEYVELVPDDRYNAEHIDREALVTAIKEALAQPEQEQLMSDQINYGMSVTQGGKRIDPMSIYKEPEQEPCCYGGIAHDCHAGEGCRIVKRMKAAQPEQDGECKYCTDGCPACDARKLPKEAHDLF